MALFTSAKEEFTLADVRLENARNPRTFLIPTAQQTDALKAGDIVKIIFVLTHQKEDEPHAERMWVKITERNGKVFTGILNNEPYYLKSIKAGELLLFTVDHIASIYGYKPLFDETKFAVISVSALHNRQINWVTRSEELHDTLDSGWQLFYGDETQAYIDDHQNSTLIKLADVLRFEPLLERVFDKKGYAYAYNHERNIFVETEL